MFMFEYVPKDGPVVKGAGALRIEIGNGFIIIDPETGNIRLPRVTMIKIQSYDDFNYGTVNVRFRNDVVNLPKSKGTILTCEVNPGGGSLTVAQGWLFLESSHDEVIVVETDELGNLTGNARVVPADANADDIVAATPDYELRAVVPDWGSFWSAFTRDGYPASSTKVFSKAEPY